MLSFHESEDWRHGSIFYSGVTSSVLSVILYNLFSTGEYLNVRTCKTTYPLFMFLIIFEVFKYFLLIIVTKFSPFNEEGVFNVMCNFKNFKLVAQSLFTLLLSCLGFHIVLVLFGAELLNKKEETLVLSILLTLVAALPLIIQPGKGYRVIFAPEEVDEITKDMFGSLIFNNSRGAIVGAWFGAFVIPLDWDRPWQQWPIPCFIGALVGYTIINYVYFAKLMFEKINRKFNIFNGNKIKLV